MDYKIFTELIIISVLAIPVVLICRKLKIPVIVGFLFAGIIINPSADFFKIMDQERIKLLADFGVICLMFTIGLESSFKQLKELRKPLLIGGTLQVGLTILVVGAIFYYFFKQRIQVSIFYGCVISLSSTALVLSFLQKNGDISLPYGRISVTILIYQDIASVLMVILFPLLGENTGGLSTSQMLLNLGKNLLILLIFSFVCYKWIIPKLLYHVAKTQSRELFILSVMFIFFTFVAVCGSLSISLALGAFIAGLLIAESPYNHRAMGGIMPFKDLFTSIFFVSIGIMLDLDFAIDNLLIIVVSALLVLIIKSIIGGIAVYVLKYPLKVAFLAGLAICQIGEFSFVLFNMGYKNLGVINESQLNYLLGIAIMTMIFTPFILQYAPKIYDMFAKIFKLNDVAEDSNTAEELSGHVVIIGFGVVGRRVAFGAKMAGLKYCVIESNPDTVKREQAKGVPIFYGDATQESVLEFAKIGKASVAAITIPGNSRTEEMTEQIRNLNKDINLLVRAKFESSIKNLIDAGATYAIADEKETSFEMLSRILRLSNVSNQNIRNIVEAQSNSDSDSLISDPVKTAKTVQKSILANVVISKSFKYIGKTLQEMDFRNKFDLSVLTIEKKKGEPEAASPNDVIKAGYSLLVLGKKDKIADFADMQLRKNEFEGDSAHDRTI